MTSDVLRLSGITASDVLLLSGIAASDVLLLSGIAAGCHLIPLSYLLPRFSALSSCSYSKIKFSSSSYVKKKSNKKFDNGPFSRNSKITRKLSQLFPIRENYWLFCGSLAEVVCALLLYNTGISDLPLCINAFQFCDYFPPFSSSLNISTN